MCVVGSTRHSPEAQQLREDSWPAAESAVCWYSSETDIISDQLAVDSVTNMWLTRRSAGSSFKVGGHKIPLFSSGPYWAYTRVGTKICIKNQSLADNTFWWCSSLTTNLKCQTHSRVLDMVSSVTAIAKGLGSCVAQLLLIHAISGCDTTSSIFGNRKVSVFKSLQKSGHTLTLSHAQPQIKKCLTLAAEYCHCYMVGEWVVV